MSIKASEISDLIKARISQFDAAAEANNVGTVVSVTDGIVRIRTLGGGVPADPFIAAFQVPTVGVSLANFDDNQHTDNENLRLGNLWNGIATLAAIMAR